MMVTKETAAAVKAAMTARFIPRSLPESADVPQPAGKVPRDM
jgi:hypothetical protein